MPAGPARVPQAKMTPFERGAGTALGLAVVAAAAWLALRERRVAGLGPAHWRGPTAGLLAFAGLLICWGSWIDPAAEPRRFIAVWCAVGAAIAVASAVACWDLLQIRRRGLAERRELLARSRAEMFASVPPRPSRLDSWRRPSDN